MAPFQKSSATIEGLRGGQHIHEEIGREMTKAQTLDSVHLCVGFENTRMSTHLALPQKPFTQHPYGLDEALFIKARKNVRGFQELPREAHIKKVASSSAPGLRNHWPFHSAGNSARPYKSTL